MECTYSFPCAYDESRKALKVAMSHDDFKMVFETQKKVVASSGEETWIAFVVDGGLYDCRISRHYDEDNYEHYLAVTIYSKGSRQRRPFFNYRYTYQSA